MSDTMGHLEANEKRIEMRIRAEMLGPWEELWRAIKEMEPELGDANKPLAIAASYALLLADAKRYQWLRNSHNQGANSPTGEGLIVCTERPGKEPRYIGPLAWQLLDQAIDKAIERNTCSALSASSSATIGTRGSTPNPSPLNDPSKSVNQAVFGSPCKHVAGCAYLERGDCAREGRCLGGWPFPDEPVDKRTPKQKWDGTDI